MPRTEKLSALDSVDDLDRPTISFDVPVDLVDPPPSSGTLSIADRVAELDSEREVAEAEDERPTLSPWRPVPAELVRPSRAVVAPPPLLPRPSLPSRPRPLAVAPAPEPPEDVELDSCELLSIDTPPEPVQPTPRAPAPSPFARRSVAQLPVLLEEPPKRAPRIAVAGMLPWLAGAVVLSAVAAIAVTRFLPAPGRSVIEAPAAVGPATASATAPAVVRFGDDDSVSIPPLKAPPPPAAPPPVIVAHPQKSTIARPAPARLPDGSLDLASSPTSTPSAIPMAPARKKLTPEQELAEEQLRAAAAR